MVRTIILLALLLHTARAQDAIDPRSAALGGETVVLTGSSPGGSLNPACLITVTRPEVTCAVSPAPFGFSELSTVTLSAALPAHGVVLGCCANRSGYDLFRRVDALLSGAAEVNGIGVGVSVVATRIEIPGYGSAAALSLNSGLCLRWGGPLTARLHLRNITHRTIGSGGTELPQEFGIGARCEPAGGIGIACDLLRTPSGEETLNGGVEWSPVAAVVFRGGFSRVPPLVTGGVGFDLGMIGIDYGYTAHETLGGTHLVGLTFHGGR